MNDKEGPPLEVGTEIRIGKEYANTVGKEFGLEEGQVIELVKGWFDHDNGLYPELHTAPAIPADDDEYHSIYHLFGNNLEDFMDCEVIEEKEKMDLEGALRKMFQEGANCVNSTVVDDLKEEEDGWVNYALSRIRRSSGPSESEIERVLGKYMAADDEEIEKAKRILTNLFEQRNKK